MYTAPTNNPPAAIDAKRIWRFRHRGQQFALVRDGEHDVELRRHTGSNDDYEVLAADALAPIGRTEFQLALSIVIEAADRAPREQLSSGARALIARFIIRAGHDAQRLAA